VIQFTLHASDVLQLDKEFLYIGKTSKFTIPYLSDKHMRTLNTSSSGNLQYSWCKSILCNPAQLKAAELFFAIYRSLI